MTGVIASCHCRTWCKRVCTCCEQSVLSLSPPSRGPIGDDPRAETYTDLRFLQAIAIDTGLRFGPFIRRLASATRRRASGYRS